MVANICLCKCDVWERESAESIRQGDVGRLIAGQRKQTSHRVYPPIPPIV